SNRWKNDLQLDLTEIFRTNLMVDIAVSWFHAWKNDEAGTGHQTLRQQETLGTYLWIGYDVTSLLKHSIVPSALPAELTVGYAGFEGGPRRLEGVRTGGEAGEKKIRMGSSQFFTPRWRGLFQFSHVLAAGGHFKKDVGVLVCVEKVF